MQLLLLQANLGQFNSWKSRWLIAWGNLCLIQGQALLVAFVATLAATVLGLFAGHSPSIKEVFLLCGSSMLAASLASLSLGILIIIIVMTSHYLTINPDNVATPIAASLGDLITLTLLSFIAHGLYEIEGYEKGKGQRGWGREREGAKGMGERERGVGKGERQRGWKREGCRQRGREREGCRQRGWKIGMWVKGMGERERGTFSILFISVLLF